MSFFLNLFFFSYFTLSKTKKNHHILNMRRDKNHEQGT